jgi:(p)ppGpp synthase/HD superfamily hydrolase
MDCRKIDLPTLALGFAMCAHRQRKQNYTGEPYANHCQNVAGIVAEYTSDPAVRSRTRTSRRSGGLSR